MDEKILVGAIILVILVSFQYTFNNILKELKEIKEILKRNSNNINK